MGTDRIRHGEGKRKGIYYLGRVSRHPLLTSTLAKAATPARRPGEIFVVLIRQERQGNVRDNS